MQAMNPQVDAYLAHGCGRCALYDTPQCKVHPWREALEHLRQIVLECGLTEELKWGVPCYTFQGGNVLLVSAFKEFCAISFFKGALLTDTDGILSKPGESSQSGRLIRFTRIQEILDLEPVLRTYVFEAIEVEKAGLKVDFKQNPEPIPDELRQKLEEMPALKAAFYSLTPGRQRGYILYFSEPKQSKTRVARIEKHIEQILRGKGINDDYKAANKTVAP